MRYKFQSLGKIKSVAVCLTAGIITSAVLLAMFPFIALSVDNPDSLIKPLSVAILVISSAVIGITSDIIHKPTGKFPIIALCTGLCYTVLCVIISASIQAGNGNITELLKFLTVPVISSAVSLLLSFKNKKKKHRRSRKH